jgi:hypothetical protein
VRIPHCCNFNPETTVLAHIRRGGIAGTGQKPPDLVAVWSCSACHDVIDGRVMLPNLSKHELDTYILEGMCRTLAAVAQEIKS